MKKDNPIILMSVLFLGIFAVNSASAYSYQSTMSPFDFLWIPFLIISIYIIIFAVWILVAIWVYKDAKKRGENAVLWLLLVIFAGLVGLIIWLIIRPPIGGKKTTPDRICVN